MTQVKKPRTPVIKTPAKADAAPDAVNALTQGMHTFHLAESNASYTYMDADVQLIVAAYKARVEVDKADERLAPMLVRIFGSDWTKEGAAPELRKPIREFIRTVLPEAQALIVERAQYQAAAKAGIVDNKKANQIRVDGRDLEGKITRMIDSAARVWRNHLAAQDPDFTPTQSTRNPQTAVKILEKAQDSLEKRGAKNVPDAEFCKHAAMLTGQIVKGRGPLFSAIMRFGATHKLSDEQVKAMLGALTVEQIGNALTAAKAQAQPA